MLYEIRTKYCFALLIAACLLPLVAGCQPTAESEAKVDAKLSDGPQVFAVCYPLEYLTGRIAGEAITVGCLVPTGMSALDWRPNREGIRKMQQADLIIANGRGAKVAKWLETSSIPDSRLCNSATRGLALQDYIAIEDLRIVHTHGPEGEHSHPTMVANTWLDPAIAQKQAAYIAEQLTRVFPEHEGSFQKNLKRLNEDLEHLASLLPTRSEDSPLSVITGSPNLKFIARAAGFEDRHLFWNESPEIEQAEEDLKRVLAVDGEPGETANREKMLLLTTIPLEGNLSDLLRNYNLRAVEIDPLEVRPESGDYLSVMTENLERIRSAVADEEMSD